MINKTDKLDVRGLNRLQRTATLPTVWIPPAAVRDQRDLPRTRMVLVRTRTRLKNRIHATLAKYALTVTDVSDLFGKQGRALLTGKLAQLPPHTRFATNHLLEQLCVQTMWTRSAGVSPAEGRARALVARAAERRETDFSEARRQSHPWDGEPVTRP
jgi:hypothetical protein